MCAEVFCWFIASFVFLFYFPVLPLSTLLKDSALKFKLHFARREQIFFLF